jgi:hypothetical protein
MTDFASEILGKNLRWIRKSQDISLEGLAVMLEAAGHPLGWKALSRTERGLRNATVGDLMALACILRVSPMDLLLPLSGEVEVPGFGGGTVRASVLGRWVAAGGALEDHVDDRQSVPV